MQQHPFFLTGPSIFFPNSRSRMTGRRISPMITWLSALLLAAVILLYPERPAWGAEIQLRADPHKIQGYAHRASLGDVLSELSRQAGFVVTIDENLYDVPTSFAIPNAIPAERAIQRIVHPHSIALVFQRRPGDATAQVSQIKVFDKGKISAMVAHIGSAGTRTGQTHHTRGANSPGGAQTSGTLAGPAAVSRYVRSPVTITENAMGFTGFNFGPKWRGPDYRPDTIALAKAYIQYRDDREAYRTNGDATKITAAKSAAETAKANYRAHRTDSIQQTVADAVQ